MLILSLQRHKPHDETCIYFQQFTFLQEACRFYTIESAFALAVAFLINISIISVSGAVCDSGNLNPEDQANCSDLDLNKASFLLKVGQEFSVFVF